MNEVDELVNRLRGRCLFVGFKGKLVEKMEWLGLGLKSNLIKVGYSVEEDMKVWFGGNFCMKVRK